MSWYSKFAPVLSLLAISVVAEGARIQFHGESTKASLSATPVASRSGVLNPVELRFDLQGVEINSLRDGFDAVEVKGLSPMQEAGNPALFTTGKIVVVPQGFEPVLEVVSQDVRTIPQVKVGPRQRKFRCGASNAFSFNSALYNSNAVYPAQAVTLEEAGNLQGARLVRVGINPLRMDMGNNALLATASLTARVSFKQVSAAAKTTITKPMYDVLVSSSANASAISANLLDVEVAESMLIVTPADYATTLADFVAWKRARGLNVDVATTADTGTTKESIKAYVQKYYDNAKVKPSYMLFVGNKTSLPAYSLPTSAGQAISDYSYTLLSGSDVLPDVFYGRLVADNADEVKLQASRWIEYEKQIDRDGSAGWNTSAMTIASDEGSDPSDSDYADMVEEALEKGTYKNFYSLRNGEDTATAKNIFEGLEKGASWIAYFGHGSGTSWGSTNDTFSNTQVAKLKNYDKLPVLIDVACLNAQWDKIAKPFGKAWATQMQDGKHVGSVAFYGGSVSISWDPPAVMSVGIAKRHFENKIPSVGGSVMAGQLYLREEMGTGNDTVDNMEWYNLLGDPSLRIFSGLQ